MSDQAIVERDLLRVHAALGVEDAQRAQRAGLPLRHRLDRIVDRRVDVLADELHGHRTAAGERHVGEFLGRRQLLQRHRDDLVFLLGAGAAHLEGLVIAGFHRIDVFLRRLVGRVGRHPQHELVEGQHGDRRQLLPAEGDAGRERGCESWIG